MVTIEDVYEQASELNQGDFKPSVKFALWCAALSTQQTLHKNCLLADLLRPYIDKPLPERDTLWRLLKRAAGVLYNQHFIALYHIEYLEKSGQLNGLENIGECYLDQVDWRDKVYKLCNGKGLAWKTISFAALILAPLSCELVPVDRHVLARLGYDNSKGVPQRKRYLAIESEVIDEQWDNNQEEIPTSLWHWYKWEEYRQLNLHSKSDVCESHGSLSCRKRA